jgi:FkbH-like protein
VFESRTGLALRRESIVTAAVNWQPKSANLRAMAERLNLGLDSFVFIDDNPVECAEVRAACPEVLTLEWPQDAAQARRLLQHTWELDPRGATAEDRRRTELYKEEFKRQELQAQTLTFRDFIASLELVVDIAPLAATPRAPRSSRCEPTSSTSRRGAARRRRLQALASSGHARDPDRDACAIASATTASSGLLIAERQGDEMDADTFLLSCRVLGRGVEHQMAAELGRIAEASQAATVRLRVDPTSRNTPARNFLLSIAPAGTQPAENGALEIALPPAVVSGITFEPPDQAPAAVPEEDRGKSPARHVETSTIRSREDQIRRTAFELGVPGTSCGCDRWPGPRRRPNDRGTR